MTKRPLPKIPKLLFYKSLVARSWYGHICAEYYPSPSIGAHIDLPQELSCFNSSGADYEMGIYFHCFILSFRLVIHWNKKPEEV